MLVTAELGRVSGQPCHILPGGLAGPWETHVAVQQAMCVGCGPLLQMAAHWGLVGLSLMPPQTVILIKHTNCPSQVKQQRSHSVTPRWGSWRVPLSRPSCSWSSEA